MGVPYTTTELELAAYLIAEGWNCKEIQWNRAPGRGAEASFVFDTKVGEDEWEEMLADIESWEDRKAQTEPRNLLITFTQLRKQMLDERAVFMQSGARTA